MTAPLYMDALKPTKCTLGATTRNHLMQHHIIAFVVHYL